MTAADVGRFILIVTLGFLALVAFVISATIVGSMWLEGSRCECLYLPVGIYILAILAILFISSIIWEIVDEWSRLVGIVENNREAAIIVLIFNIFIILVLILPA